MYDTKMNEELKENGRIAYFGFADQAQASNRNMSSAWKAYSATPEGYQQAIKDGYTAVSVFEFSHEVPNERNKAQPLRFGDLLLDFDAKKNVLNENGEVVGQEGDIAAARTAVIGFIDYMDREHELNPEDLFYFASGSKGFHVIVPCSLFGITHGNIELHLIYKNICYELFRLHRGKKEFFREYVYEALSKANKYIESDFESYIDDCGFKGGKGQLIRLPNIKRADDKYKVPVTCDEICNESVEFFKDIVLNKRVLEDEELRFAQRANLKPIPKLEELFNKCRDSQNIFKLGKNSRKATFSIQRECTFLQHCMQYPIGMEEPIWFDFAKITSRLGKLGSDIFIHFSKLDTRRFNRLECINKLKHARNYAPICKDIRVHGFCDKGCQATSPIDLFEAAHANSDNTGRYVSHSSGLLHYPNKDDETDFNIIASPVELISFTRDTEQSGWARLIVVTDPDGHQHYCTIPFTDFTGTGEMALKTLTDKGLILSRVKDAKTLLFNYLQDKNISERGLFVDKNGWVNSSLKCNDRKKFKYFPLDQGEQEDGTHLYARHNTDHLQFEQRGTLEDWQNHIARPCEGNPLLQLAIMTSLSGPFLTLERHQGFGVHFYANSSSGKTTALKVASSVTGCRMKGWRTTSNALESVAAQHNDNCLLLDEVSMGKAENLDEIAYMLANGRGKSRAKRTGEACNVPTWNLVFLSSGEIPIGDRINQAYNRTVMAGQEVRCISILADGGKNIGIFTTLPEGELAAEFADMLVRDSDAYKGAPLGALIYCIKFDELDPLIEVDKYSKTFLNKYVKGLEAQALRVAKNFAFIGAVGELCIDNKILPWNKDSAFEAARKCLQLWLDHNGTVSNFEAKNIAEKILKDAGSNFYNKFNASEAMHQNSDPVQKYTTKDGKECWFIARKFLEREGYLKDYQYSSVVDYLHKNKHLVLDRYGKVQTQRWTGSNNNRPRGFSIVKDTIYLDDISQGDVTIVEASTEANKEHININMEYGTMF